MNVVIFGATGMVGSGVLLECLDDPRVTSVLVVGRGSVGMAHPKLQEILHTDFFDFTSLEPRFAGLDACFFCLGVTAAGKSEEEYRRLTYDVTLAAAKAMIAVSPRMTFCYISGAGTDSSASGRVMWARVKGATENALLKLGFGAAYMFRPGFIQPMRGVRSKTPLYQGFYVVLGPVIPLLRWFFPKHVTTTVTVGGAMIQVAAAGYSSPFIEMGDIERIGRRDLGPLEATV